MEGNESSPQLEAREGPHQDKNLDTQQSHQLHRKTGRKSSRRPATRGRTTTQRTIWGSAREIGPRGSF